jgi:hypothetical protein
MTRDEAAELVKFLSGLTDVGFTVLTWNGLGFDFDILAEESGMENECKNLARGHVDMMFHAFCELGHGIGLDRAAKAMGLPGKPSTVPAESVPQFWADGRTDEVLDYVSQDVRNTLGLVETCEQSRSLRWMAHSGNIRELKLRSGWLTVDDAMRLPEPDTSWMNDPWPRSKFTGWL